MRTRVQRCDPVTQLHPSRLDVVAKFLFFRGLLTTPDPQADSLYRRHIARRTGGFEGAKSGVEDYAAAATRLLESLRSRGFDPDTPIRVGRNNGLPLDGAHRLAAGLALETDVLVEHVDEEWGGTWDYEWFERNGFPRDDLDLLVRTYVRLSRRSIAFIFWGSTRERWGELSESLRQDAAIVATIDVALDALDLSTVVEDVYAWQLGPRINARIEDKARAVSAAAPTVRCVLVDAPVGQDDLQTFATRVKRRLRAVAGNSADDFWTTVHATDDPVEARYVVDLFFCQNYLRMLALRRDVRLRSTFLNWLEHYIQTLASQQIPQDDACIVGSSVLEAVGVRDSTDIDFIVGARAPRFHSGVVKVADGVDLVTSGYHRRADGGPTFTDEAVIRDPRLHVHVRGLKFANPELVIDRKRQHGRPKDLADVMLWGRRVSELESQPELTRTVVLFTAQPLDGKRFLALDRRRREHAQRGERLIVAGVPQVITSATGWSVEGLPRVDDLPVALFADDDPRALLEQMGVDVPVLMAAEAARSGSPGHPGHALLRVKGFAWMARWLRSWLAPLRPSAVVVEGEEAEGLLLQMIASRLPETAVEFGRRRISDTCRLATEQARIVTAAARSIAALESSDRPTSAQWAEAQARLAALESTSLEHARVSRWWQVAAQSHRVSLWLWGAGAAGHEAVAWLAAAGARVSGVVDSDASKHGLAVGSVRVSAPSVLRDANDGTVRVAIASVHADAIRAAAAELGIQSRHISVLGGQPPVFTADE